MRYVIDACNVWIENCILLQHDVDIKSIDIKKMFVLDRALLSDLLLYGIASHTMSLLMLSRNKDMKCPYYGINVDTKKIIPIEPIKYHPYIYYDTVITGECKYGGECPARISACHFEGVRAFASLLLYGQGAGND